MQPTTIALVGVVVLALAFVLWKRLSSKAGPKNENDVVVAQVQDMQDGEMKVVKVHEESILLIKDKGSFCAMGNTCSHAMASLSTGSYLEGRIRCPWHGACFNTKTGDIEDHPCALKIPTFKVHVEGQNVVVSATPEEVKVKKVTPKMVKRGDDQRVFVIVGAGAAGSTAAFSLREEGFAGRIVLIGAEKFYPYDRTRLSKVLSSSADPAAKSNILVRQPEEYAKYDIEYLAGVTVTLLNSDAKKVSLSTGTTLAYDSCLVASGANPLRLEKWIKGNEVPRKNVHVLRNVDEGGPIQNACVGKKVVIIGSSFIGIETSAAVVATAESVLVIGMENVPFERVLGVEIGGLLQKFHESKKVQFKMGAVCAEFKIGDDDCVHTIILKDQTEIPCDVVIIGAGVFPATQFIEGKSVKRHSDQSIIADANLFTGAPGLYVAGDIARFPLFCLNHELARIEHWGIAQTMGRIAAKNMVHSSKQVAFRSVPVFWTAAFGKSVRYAGHGIGVDQTLVDYCGVTPDPTNPKFVTFYCRNGIAIAISSMNVDPVVADFAQLLHSGIPLYAKDLVGEVKAGSSATFVHNTLLSASRSGSKKSQ